MLYIRRDATFCVSTYTTYPFPLPFAYSLLPIACCLLPKKCIFAS